MWSLFTDELENSVAANIPHKPARTRNGLPWVTQNLRRPIKKRDHAHHGTKKNFHCCFIWLWIIKIYLIWFDLITGWENLPMRATRRSSTLQGTEASSPTQTPASVLEAHRNHRHASDWHHQWPSCMQKTLLVVHQTQEVRHQWHIYISPLKDQDRLSSESVDKANILSRQFKSAFSLKSVFSWSQFKSSCRMTTVLLGLQLQVATFFSTLTPAH